MIRKPTVGMRVKVTGDRYCADCRNGDMGAIISVNKNLANFRVKLDTGKTWSFKNDSVTEIKENDMKKGDLVTVGSTSGYICLSKYPATSMHMSYCGTFKIEELLESYCCDSNGRPVHDIVLRNVETGNVWLHSKQHVIQEKVKEISPEQMMAACEEKYGGKVKITKK